MLYILQNKEGVKLYGGKIVSEEGKNEFEKQIRNAFAMAIPTNAMRERRLKEGRGFGDLDGGGGVYKGKKSNKSKQKREKLKCTSKAYEYFMSS